MNLLRNKIGGGRESRFTDGGTRGGNDSCLNPNC